MLSEGIGYAHGNLGREWSSKVIESTGKQVLENALAYQPSKDDQTVWCDLTLWESDGGDPSHFDAIMGATSKGSRIIIRGKFKTRSYKAKDGTTKTGWSCSVWDIAPVVRTNRTSAWDEGQTVQEGLSEEKKRQLEQIAGFDPNEPPF